MEYEKAPAAPFTFEPPSIRCRRAMADDQERSVGRDYAAWDVPGLYVCDGSVFVTSSASNPSLTTQAIAALTADGLVAAGKHYEL